MSETRKNCVTARGRMADGTPNPIDKYVGKRIQMRRQLLGWSQEKLGKELKITFQQVQKYENGENRIGASRLWDAACALGVKDVNYFFEGMSEETLRQSPRRIGGISPEGLTESFAQMQSGVDPMSTEEAISLVRAYLQAGNKEVAKCLFEAMVKNACLGVPKKGKA